MIGSIGAVHHYEYRAVGDIVNTASRIQNLNKQLGTRLLASATTVEGLDEFVTRPLGNFVLPGKTIPVGVVELLGRREDAALAQRRMDEPFAQALAAYAAGRWQDAAARFSEILGRVSEDGPSRFYLRQCEELVAHPPPAGWEPIVRLDAK